MYVLLWVQGASYDLQLRITKRLAGVLHDYFSVDTARVAEADTNTYTTSPNNIEVYNASNILYV